ncbi:ATP-binding cassette domain-containing protein [Patescibacteria group bacterium]|nr:MAG: ATP-binding cassette domain-containing protein [Patescibacteria group bacterium]
MLTIQNLHKIWRENDITKAVFDGFSLTVTAGDFVGIVGPNGVGKSTLFNIIAGLDHDYQGQVFVDETSKYAVGYVFQNYRQSLFPWCTVFENIAYPLKLRGKTISEQEEAVSILCKEFDIFINLSKYPYELSGGQQQIVAILRALIFKPDILLLDEPFSAVDYDATYQIIAFIQKVWKKTGITTLLISHDLDEVLLLCRRIVVLGGKPVSVKTDVPHRLEYPRNIDVMGNESFVQTKRMILRQIIK